MALEPSDHIRSFITPWTRPSQTRLFRQYLLANSLNEIANPQVMEKHRDQRANGAFFPSGYAQVFCFSRRLLRV
jgi:hypothetical protein